MSDAPHGAGGNRLTFEELWPSASSIKGWLTDDQARRLWSEAAQLEPASLAVEIGSHQGRSTVVLAAALAGRGCVVAIDPFVEGPMFGGRSTRTAFEANLSTYQVAGAVRLIPEYSTRVRPSWTEPIDLLYIDGKHDYWTCSDDLRWSVHLRRGATVLVHDAFSSIGVTLALLVHVLGSRNLRYVGRDGSLARFRAEPPAATDRLRMLAQLPWWMRNVTVKVLLRLRLRRMAGVLGHRDRYDPY